MKLEITKERILAMAEECPEAKAVLEEGFPEVFKEKWTDITNEIVWKIHSFGGGDNWLMGTYGDKKTAQFYFTNDGLHFNNSKHGENFEYKKRGSGFCIMKKN